MSFVDQRRNVRPASVAAVVLVHVAIGYAVVSGLAYTVIGYIPTVTHVDNYKEDFPPPPPVKELPPPPSNRAMPSSRPVSHDPLVRTVDTKPVEISQIPFDPKIDVTPTRSADPFPPATPNLSRGAGAVGDRASWVTTSDYPASAIRAGAEGTTAIRVMIGADGRASDCRITATSGNPALDEAACRTYLRRARFRPALDQVGHPIASEHLDRIRWTLPSE